MAPPHNSLDCRSLALALQGLHDLAHSIQQIASTPSNFVLHRTQCLCLAKSYVLAIQHVKQQLHHSDSQKHRDLFPSLSELYHAMLQGRKFLCDCQLLHDGIWVKKALVLALSTEAQDVCLHDLVWCLCVIHQAMGQQQTGDDIYSTLAHIWAVEASHEEDVHVLLEALKRQIEGWKRRKEGWKHRLLNTTSASVDIHGQCPLAEFLLQRLSKEHDNASTSRPLDALPHYLRVDPCEINIKRAAIARGAFAVLNKVEWHGVTFGQKQFSEDIDEAVFAKEAAIQARLRHPNLLQLVCCTYSNPYDGQYGLLLQLMDTNLRTVIVNQQKRHGSDPPFSLLTSVDLMLQMAMGMEHLHSLQIMHRDLKSFNLLVTYKPAMDESLTDCRMRLKIADFGVSKAKYISSRYTTLRSGTTNWMAPELFEVNPESGCEDQATTSKYTKKADVYSFAMVCYEILSGNIPFEEGGKLSELSQRLWRGERPKLPSRCPPYLASYIEKCWEGDPEKRPSFAQICRAMRHLKGILLSSANPLNTLPALSTGGLSLIEDKLQGAKGVNWPLSSTSKVRTISFEMACYRAVMEGRCLPMQKLEDRPGTSKVMEGTMQKLEDSSEFGSESTESSSQARTCNEGFINVEFKIIDEGPHEDSVGLLSKTMVRLEEEFKGLLITNSKPQEPARLIEYLPNSVRSTPSGSQGGGDESAGNGVSPRPANDKTNKGPQSFGSLIPPKIIPHLHELAQRMITAGHHQQCCKIYRDTRAAVLEQTLRKLGVEKLSREDVHKMQWEVLEGKITSWIHFMRIAVKLLFSGERKVCDQVFHELEPYRETCFAEVTSNSVTMLLSFGEGIANSKKSPEKLFVLLDMYDTMRELYPEVEAIFGGKPSADIRESVSGLTQRLAQTAEETFGDFSEAVEKDVTKTPVQDGTVHPLTSYVINYVKFLLEYQTTLRQLFGEDETVEPANSQLASATMKIMSALQSNLDGKSKLYRDPALAHVFLMNNIHYMVKSVRRSEAKDVLGEDWVQRHRRIVQQHAQNYKRVAWTKVVQSLSVQGLASSGSTGVSRALLKERLKTFNIQFDELYQCQTQWFVPDVELRESLRLAVAEVLLPTYRFFLKRFGSLMDSGKNPQKYVRFSPEELGAKLGELFEGR